MTLQTLTLQLPDPIYQRLVELAAKSEQPLEETAVHFLNSAIAADTEITGDINQQLAQLTLLTDEEIWQAATSKASEEDNDLMQSLLEKQQREGLTSNETSQIQDLSNRFNQIMIIRAKSAVILKERGHDISTISPSS